MNRQKSIALRNAKSRHTQSRQSTRWLRRINFLNEMPTKDLYHDTVKAALDKDGWTVTDNLSLKVGKRDLFIDMGAEKLLIAERANQKIAVEVKSFIGASPVSDLEQALGQYLLYEDLLQTQYPDRLLYLAIRDTVYSSFFQEEIVQIVLTSRRLKLLIFDEIQEVIIQWIPEAA